MVRLRHDAFEEALCRLVHSTNCISVDRKAVTETVAVGGEFSRARRGVAEGSLYELREPVASTKGDRALVHRGLLSLSRAHGRLVSPVESVRVRARQWQSLSAVRGYFGAKGRRELAESESPHGADRQLTRT